MRDLPDMVLRAPRMRGVSHLSEQGLATAEYAVCSLAAAGFGAVLYAMVPWWEKLLYYLFSTLNGLLPFIHVPQRFPV